MVVESLYFENSCQTDKRRNERRNEWCGVSCNCTSGVVQSKCVLCVFCVC